MRVRDKETRTILESENEFTVAQWMKHPEKYAKLKDKDKGEHSGSIPLKTKKDKETEE